MVSLKIFLTLFLTGIMFITGMLVFSEMKPIKNDWRIMELFDKIYCIGLFVVTVFLIIVDIGAIVGIWMF